MEAVSRLLRTPGIHAMQGSMQKLQILFPDPQMDALRRLARIEDRPVSELVRRAVDRDLEQRSALLNRTRGVPAVFPTFYGGRVLVPSSQMKSLLYGDEPK